MQLKELKKIIKNIEITYDYGQTYCDLYNAVIDYQNETQDWCFEYVFEDFCDDWVLKELVQHKLENEGIWSVKNLLEDVTDGNGIYRIDAYGYGHDLDKADLETIQDEILTIINIKLEEE